MHLTLKRALLRLVDLPLPENAPAEGEQRFPRTAEDLARLTRVSADHLRHLAADAGIPLGQLLHRHLALRSLEMLAAGLRPEVVADRLGYESTSGILELIRRRFDRTAAAILETGIHQYWAETARLIEPHRADRDET